MNKQEILKIIKGIELGLLNLEIQTAQIQNDSAARGSMVAAEHIEAEVLKLKELLK